MYKGFKVRVCECDGWNYFRSIQEIRDYFAGIRANGYDEFSHYEITRLCYRRVILHGQLVACGYEIEIVNYCY